MLRLGLDTSYKDLVICLINDDQLLDSYCADAFKKQSETVFVELDKLMKKNGLTPDDIDEVVITRGPGSYTGIRIAMSIAKVFCTLKNKPLKTVSTLQMYAGLKDVSVILDARSNRVYYGKYHQGKKVEEGIKTLDEIRQLDEIFIGDTYLIDQNSEPVNLVQNLVDLIPYYETVDNIHTLVPEYLKSNEDYLK